MHVTRETDYAIRCVCYLAQRPKEVVPVEDISAGTSVPRDFMAKILQKLARALIVRSRRGVNGGFELARSPSAISFLDVIEAIQGPVSMNVCAMDKKLCSRSNSCAVHPVWMEVREQVNRLLARKNFARFRAKTAKPGQSR